MSHLSRVHIFQGLRNSYPIMITSRKEINIRELWQGNKSEREIIAKEI